MEGIFDHISDFTPKMQTQLLENKEIAFLSQQLATIITDVDIPEIVLEKTANKFTNDAYVEVLKKYEFKSLYPKNVAVITQEREVIDSEKITEQKDFDAIILNDIMKTKLVGIEIDASNIIFLSSSEKIYEINPIKIDISELVENIFSGKIIFSAFDAKNILRAFHEIKNPKIQKNEFQEMLF